MRGNGDTPGSLPLARPAPRTALTIPEAAASLGVSTKSLYRHVLGELRVVRRGSLVLVPVSELRAWLEREADYTIPKEGGDPT
jgi:excisionase family DNA binding protein